jgi:alpha-amylase
MMKQSSLFPILLVLAILFTGCSQPVQPTPAQTQAPAATKALSPTARPSVTTTLEPTEAPPADWLMFRANPKHAVAPVAMSGEGEWTFVTQGMVISSPVFYDGAVYFTSMDGKLYKLDAASGKQIWQADVGKDAISSPAVVDGVVYVGGGKGLFAVDAETGKVRWTFAVDQGVQSSPAISAGKVYFGGLDGKVYALDAVTGKKAWEFAAQGPVGSSPAVVDGKVYIGSNDNHLYILDEATGKLDWSYKASDEIPGSPAVSGGMLMFGDLSGNFYIVDLTNPQSKFGIPLWKGQVGVGVMSSPVFDEGVLYVGTLDGNLIAADAAKQGPLWVFQAAGAIVSTPLVADETVYFGSEGGLVYALDRKTGQEKWHFRTGGDIWSSPILIGEQLLIGSQDGALYSLNKDGPQMAQFIPPTPLPLDPTPTPLPDQPEQAALGSNGLPWWNDRVFYEVFVRSFKDSNGDGNGDLKGLIEKLDYLNDGDPKTTTDLGVTGLWLMPVNEAASYHGYDAVDYKQIEQDYGTNEDFKTLVAEAHKRGIAVIVDLVMNHTSNQHPWFVNAKPGSPTDNYYIWQYDKPTGTRSWDGAPDWYRLGNRYYYGLFWSGMPDLNYRNGAVTDEMFDIIRFWLEDMGADGFRLDAIRHIIEEGAQDTNTNSTHQWLKNFDNFVESVNPQALTVGEAWDQTGIVAEYVKDDEVDIAFEFNLAEAILQSLYAGDNRKLMEAAGQVLADYPPGQFATFLSNHDQDRVMTQLRYDPARAEAAATLLLTLPGVPFIYYGDEIGMPGDIKPDENARTPMQWKSADGAGFTSSTAWLTIDPSYLKVNVAAQDQDAASLLNHYRQLIHLRAAHPALRSGEMLLVESGNPQVFAYLRTGENEQILTLVNLSGKPVDNVALSLASGTLNGQYQAKDLLGAQKLARLKANAAGGFDAYTPLPTLEPYQQLVIDLK